MTSAAPLPPMARLYDAVNAKKQYSKKQPARASLQKHSVYTGSISGTSRDSRDTTGYRRDLPRTPKRNASGGSTSSTSSAASSSASSLLLYSLSSPVLQNLGDLGNDVVID